MTKTIRRTETQPTRVGLKGATRGWEKHSEIPPPHRLHTIDSSTQPVPIMRSLFRINQWISSRTWQYGYGIAQWCHTRLFHSKLSFHPPKPTLITTKTKSPGLLNPPPPPTSPGTHRSQQSFQLSQQKGNKLLNEIWMKYPGPRCQSQQPFTLAVFGSLELRVCIETRTAGRAATVL